MFFRHLNNDLINFQRITYQMKKILPITLFCLFFNVNTFADNNKSCNDGFSFYKTNASNKAFPIFKIESISNKKIKIKKFKIAGYNKETIYEQNISLIIDPYSIKTFEPFNFASAIITREEIPNLNPKVIKDYYLTCEWYDEKSSMKNLKNKITFLMCSNSSDYYPRLPTTYQEYLDDNNHYYAISKKKIAMGWNWKEGKFSFSIPILSDGKELILAISEDFWNTKSKKSKYFLGFNKYSMQMMIGIGYLDKNLFTKDEIKMRRSFSKCSTIDINELGKLKPRID